MRRRGPMFNPVEQAEVDRLFGLLRRARVALSLKEPLEDRRAALNRGALPVAEDVAVSTEDTAVGVPSEWISTPGVGPAAILYVHGGGFTLGGLDDVREFLSRISRASCTRVLHPNYRLAPEYPFPAALDDLRSTYVWLRERLDASQIVVMGDSAGGGLALSLVMSLRDGASDLPAGLVMMSPWVDLAMRGESYVDRADRDPIETAEVLEWSARAYAAGTSLTDPRISPIYGNFAGLPPMMVLVGSEEMMYDDSIGIERRARALGVDVTLDIEPGMPHVYPRFAARLTAGQRAVERMGDFVKARFHQDT
jgi:epsilon-lactone hydrolase